jgi:hypothetical protein
VTFLQLAWTRVATWAGAALILIFASLLSPPMQAQAAPYEKTFPQSKAAVEKALKALQSNLGGHLPALEGFAQPGEALDRYQRAYYQATVQITSTPSGGSLVRITTKLTAWFNDPSAAHSGYQLLTSNGRIESDLLDQLSEQLAQSSTASPAKAVTAKAVPAPPSTPAAESPVVESKVPFAPRTSSTDHTFSSSVSQSLAAQERASAQIAAQPNTDKGMADLQAEADSLEETLRNQAHPKNLVAVKKSGTPVVSTPSLTAKPEFMASLHDEFEMLDFNRDWVHVRISGLSRGWIWRNSVEMPEGIPDTDAAPLPAVAPAADLFHVIREETAPFPGDWAPLRGKSVKILSVQKLDDATKDGGPKEKLEYSKFLLDKSYTELAKNPQELAGVVVIFDAADGGMIAATLPVLQQWRAGNLSDSALWHKCFFDPPETFDSTGSSASQ